MIHYAIVIVTDNDNKKSTNLFTIKWEKKTKMRNLSSNKIKLRVCVENCRYRTANIELGKLKSFTAYRPCG